MAIAFDLATDGGNNSGGSNSLTYAHTVTGSDTFLAVAVAGDVTSGADDVTGVTYSGVAMTLAAKVTSTNIARFLYLYYLFGAATGANNVVVSSTAAHYLLSTCASYTGVDSGGLDAAAVTNSVGAGANSLSVSITTNTANAWVIGAGHCYDGGGGNTIQAIVGVQRVVEGTFYIPSNYDNGPIASPGSAAIEIGPTLTPNFDGIGLVLIAIKPQTGAPSGGPLFMQKNELRPYVFRPGLAR